MAHIEDVLLCAIAQEGKPYILGAEASKLDPDPPAFDCSELVQYACDRAGVNPPMPDGAFWQYKHCLNNGNLIDVPTGITTRGALLFRVTRLHPSAFDDVPHVVFSAGDGMTVEARGHAWGIGSWAAPGRFQAAGLIPGVDYSAGHDPLPAPVAPTLKEDDMAVRFIKAKDPIDAHHNVDTVYVMAADLTGPYTPAPDEAWLVDAAGRLKGRIVPPPDDAEIITIKGVTVEVVSGDFLRPLVAR